MGLEWTCGLAGMWNAVCVCECVHVWYRKLKDVLCNVHVQECAVSQCMRVCGGVCAFFCLVLLLFVVAAVVVVVVRTEVSWYLSPPDSCILGELFTKRPLFPGYTEIGQLELIR